VADRVRACASSPGMVDRSKVETTEEFASWVRSTAAGIGVRLDAILDWALGEPLDRDRVVVALTLLEMVAADVRRVEGILLPERGE
jgi:hypothetical protein